MHGKFDMRNIKKNYKGVVNRWGQPASALFNNGQRQIRRVNEEPGGFSNCGSSRNAR